MFSVNGRIEKLKKEIANLRKEVKELKDILLHQNELILSLLSQQNGMLEETMKLERTVPHVFYCKKISEFSRRFPLENLQDLEKFETEISEENKSHIVGIIQSLLSPQGLLKNVVNVLSENIIMETNVDGHHNKQRLLNYPKTIDVIFLACRKGGDYTLKIFLDDLRRSIRVVKNRCHKNNCRARQKLREEQEQETPADPNYSFAIKTEEIYFD